MSDKPGIFSETVRCAIAAHADLRSDKALSRTRRVRPSVPC